MQTYVVIVTYNAAQWLCTCLNSLRASTIPLSVVIVDNNSADDTISIIQHSFKEVTLLKSARNLGFGKANNKGIAYALSCKADYIFLLNQDAWIRPHTIEQLIAVSQQHPEFYILSPLHLNGTEKELDANFSRYASPDYCRQLVSDCMCGQPLRDVYETTFVNAALWLLPAAGIVMLGGFDPVFPHYGEDDDFINRLHYHGYKAGICPAAVGVHARSQEPYNLDTVTPKKRYSRMKVNLLISLKDINQPFVKQLLKAYGRILKGLLTSTLRGKFSYTLSYIRLFFTPLPPYHS